MQTIKKEGKYKQYDKPLKPASSICFIRKGEKMAENNIHERTLLSEIENEDLVLMLNKNDRNSTLPKIGYEINGDGILIDSKTKEPKLAEDGRSIRISEDERLILVGAGSHHFIRNVIGYIKYLSDAGKLEIEED